MDNHSITGWTLVIATVSYFAGVLSPVVSDFFRGRFFKPDLRLSFDRKAPGYIFDTTDNTPLILMGATGPSGGMPSGTNTIYVRFRVVNLGNRIAKNCRAYLTGFKRLDDSEKLLETVYADTIPLCWSYRLPDDPYGIDIPKGPFIHCDVFATHEGKQAMSPCLVKRPNNCGPLFSAPGTYVFEIMLTADEVPKQDFKLKVVWKGSWNDFEASQYE